MTIDGCVSGAGRLGIEAGPEGGARFIAGPAAVRDGSRRHRGRPVAEHLRRGGTSEGSGQQNREHKRREQTPAPPGSTDAITPCSWPMLFTENAANSSLRPHGCRALEPAATPACYRSEAALRHNPCLAHPYRGINHACASYGGAAPQRIALRLPGDYRCWIF